MTTKTFNAIDFLLEFYGPICDGMASDTQEERLAEAKDIATNYKEEVIDCMEQKKLSIEKAARVLNKNVSVSYDSTALKFTIQQ